MARRRRLNVFNLAFLDCMSCGFGAVILFFMIINRGSTAEVTARTDSLQAEAEMLQIEVEEGKRHLVVLRNLLDRVENEEEEAKGRSARVIEMLRTRSEELADMRETTLASREHVAALKADLESLEKDTRRLEGASHGQEEQGRALRTFVGEGDRQYLTGLKVGGKHIFILLDASASMLDDTVVNVLRRRNMSKSSKKASKKWQRAVRSVDWLSAQMPADAKFQIHTFNTETTPVVEGTRKRWLDASSAKDVNAAIDGLREVVPEDGTSLHNAFRALSEMDPPPDNVFLLTDGLPTQARGEPLLKNVTAARRMSHFMGALKELPANIPVNVLLFPMEGDPHAAYAFWALARQSRGSFVSPSRDWP